MVRTQQCGCSIYCEDGNLLEEQVFPAPLFVHLAAKMCSCYVRQDVQMCGGFVLQMHI